MFHRRFIHCVIEAKENSQNAPRLEIDFVLNFAFYFTTTIQIVLREYCFEG